MFAIGTGFERQPRRNRLIGYSRCAFQLPSVYAFLCHKIGKTERKSLCNFHALLPILFSHVCMPLSCLPENVGTEKTPLLFCNKGVMRQFVKKSLAPLRKRLSSSYIFVLCPFIPMPQKTLLPTFLSLLFRLNLFLLPHAKSVSVLFFFPAFLLARSEERRVGKECRL